MHVTCRCRILGEPEMLNICIKKFTVDLFGSVNSSDRPKNVASVKRGPKTSFYGVGRLLAPRGPRVPS